MEVKKNYVYKYCIVPLCKNTNKSAPTKWFFPVPKGDKIRTKWCKLMKRNPAKLSPTSSLLCCDDHFDLENDTVNYMEYKIMSKTLGRRVSLRLKQGTLPHIFECQKSYKRPLQKTTDTPSDSKRAALRDKTFVEYQMLSPKKEFDADQAASSDDYSTEVGHATKMVGCSIRKCKSKSVKLSFITFFSFPLNETVAKEWLKYCESNTTTDNGYVCSLHFSLADYVQLNPKRIKPTAVPSLNIDNDDSLVNPLNRCQEKGDPISSLIQVKKEFREMKTEESPFFAERSKTMTLQPERVEQCSKCKQKVKSIYLHICHVDVQVLNVENLVCGACEECMTNVKNFVIHVLSSHATCVESMFFPTSAEFLQWKSEMEAQTHTRYIVYERSDNKKFYHCDYIDEIDKMTSHVCPSLLVVQEFSKGIQVHYYKTHHKHNSVAYSLSNQFKKYSISSFLQENSTQDDTSTDDKDLYLEFKNVMKGIIVDAAKINKAKLKILLDMAFEMAAIVTNCAEEKEEDEINNHHLTDDQITKELEIKVSGKRKTDDTTSLKVKHPKLVMEDNSDIAPKIVNTFSLATDVKFNEKLVEVKKEVEDTEEVKEDERDPYSSAFNDSYKDFVVKNFAVPMEGKQRLKRQVVKTKIGQFKPVTPPKGEETPKVDKDKPKIVQKPKVNKPKLVERLKPKLNVKGIVKNLSPRLSFEKPIEPKYEVKEREGDCNILILKI